MKVCSPGVTEKRVVLSTLSVSPEGGGYPYNGGIYQEATKYNFGTGIHEAYFGIVPPYNEFCGNNMIS